MLYKISKGGVGMTLFVGFLVYLGVPVELAEGGAAGIMSLLAQSPVTRRWGFVFDIIVEEVEETETAS
jgi:hypothetical protein